MHAMAISDINPVLLTFLVGIVFYCQYMQIKLKTSQDSRKLVRWLNVFCLVIGIIAAFGASVVANFQETSDITMHLIGANMIFGVGAGYFIFQVSKQFLC